MKSIEEKAKAYDAALAMAKECITYVPDDAVKKYMLNMFPELKEREDEKTRKDILAFIKRQGQHIDKFKWHKWIVWLEKQGQNTFIVEEIKRRKELLLIEKEKACSRNEHMELGGRIAMLEELLAFANEKQDESTDKIEPKFKVGDWITNDITKDVFLIKSINNGYYTLEDIKGNIIFPCLPPCEKESHLWTIADAKDDDILAVENRPFIYNGKVNPISVGGYCGIDINYDFKIKEQAGYGIWTGFDTDIHPATKEQSDFLFSKMHESGYEWDSVNFRAKILLTQ